MVSSFDTDQFLWLGERGDERFEGPGRGELIARSADE